MDTLYTFWDNITHYKTESVHFLGLLNSATRELTSAPEALDPKPAKIAKPYSGNPEEPLLVQIHQPTLRTPKTGIRESPYILTRMYATKTQIVRVSRVGRPLYTPIRIPALKRTRERVPGSIVGAGRASGSLRALRSTEGCFRFQGVGLAG